MTHSTEKAQVVTYGFMDDELRSLPTLALGGHGPWGSDPSGYCGCADCNAEETTQTGIPVTCCDACGNRHPVTRMHCATCGLAHLFPCAQKGRRDV